MSKNNSKLDTVKNGKGSKERPTNKKIYRQNWDEIDWKGKSKNESKDNN